MNARKRRRKALNHALAGGHSVLDHKKRENPRYPSRLREDGTMTGPHYLPVNCTQCLPPVTSGFKEQTRQQQLSQPTPPKGWRYKFKIDRRKAKTQGGAHSRNRYGS